jgi:hypothetical protein
MASTEIQPTKSTNNRIKNYNNKQNKKNKKGTMRG